MDIDFIRKMSELNLYEDIGNIILEYKNDIEKNENDLLVNFHRFKNIINLNRIKELKYCKNTRTKFYLIRIDNILHYNTKIENKTDLINRSYKSLLE